MILTADPTCEFAASNPSKRCGCRESWIACNPLVDGMANRGEIFLFLAQCLKRCAK